jgi:Protein of unknown function (DUF1275)
VSYLGLGRVFTANMTGNVVAAEVRGGGRSGFSVAASLASLGAFLVGAVGAGRMVLRVPRRRMLLLTALVIEGALTAGACLVAYAATSVSSGWARFAVIVLLAFGMGAQFDDPSAGGTRCDHDGAHDDADRSGGGLVAAGRDNTRPSPASPTESDLGGRNSPDRRDTRSDRWSGHHGLLSMRPVGRSGGRGQSPPICISSTQRWSIPMTVRNRSIAVEYLGKAVL